jgi:hypothetical protein
LDEALLVEYVLDPNANVPRRTVVEVQTLLVECVYADSELLFKRSLAIAEKSLGPPDVAMSLANLSGLYQRQGR